MNIGYILQVLKENYKKLYNQVMEETPYFREQKSEQICGAISTKIHSFLIATFPEYQNHFHYTTGKYVGEGTQYSGGLGGTYHCWVEIELPNGKDKIIIDGASSQFLPPTTPPEEKDRVRLRIFMPEEKGIYWYWRT